MVALPSSSENCEKYPIRVPSSMVTVPESGWSWSRASFRRVDFPEPFRPMSPTRSPGSSRKKTSRSTGRSSNRTVTSCRRMRLMGTSRGAGMRVGCRRSSSGGGVGDGPPHLARIRCCTRDRATRDRGRRSRAGARPRGRRAAGCGVGTPW